MRNLFGTTLIAAVLGFAVASPEYAAPPGYAPEAVNPPGYVLPAYRGYVLPRYAPFEYRR